MEDSEVSLNSEWRSFLNESLEDRTIFTYIQGLQEIISNLNPKTMTEKRRLSLANQHLREVKRYARRMQNEVSLLQEKLNILEESNRGDK
jgi:hypothetical protein|tara:strand:- start:518 stop:787 length:270 start_codon:yes stop_codon:yes gene_type:complete